MHNSRKYTLAFQEREAEESRAICKVFNLAKYEYPILSILWAHSRLEVTQGGNERVWKSLSHLLIKLPTEDLEQRQINPLSQKLLVNVPHFE